MEEIGRDKDIIVAPATSLVPSAIGIIRISGRDLKPFISRFINIKKLKEPRKLYFTRFLYEDRTIDDVQIVYYPAGHSYTGEEMIEIFTHGSPVGMEYMINILIENGARMAERGEFSLRALLNNKISPLEAESIYERIEASNITEYFAALELGNKAEKFINHVKEKIEEWLSLIEVNIDFPDEEITFDRDILVSNMKKTLSEIEDSLNNTKKFIGIRRGISVTVAGLPNVGKSSIFNLILGEKRALVYDKPGTTRDRITSYININGISVELNDTAGLRDTEDPIEKMGMEITMDGLKKSLLIIFVTDVSEDWKPEEKEFLKIIKRYGKDILIVGNKLDRGEKKKNVDISLSALDNNYRDNLVESIYSRLKHKIEFLNDVYFSNERHLMILEHIRNKIEEAQKELALNEVDWLEIVALSLREALHSVNRLNGRIVDDEKILSSIFDKFCIGK